MMNEKELEANTCTEPGGKMRTSKTRLFLVLLRIGLEGGTNFTNQSLRAVKGKPKRRNNYFRYSTENHSIHYSILDNLPQPVQPLVK